MILLTTDKMEQCLEIIWGHKPEDTREMEGDTFSFRCPKCKERMWGFESKPEYGISSCPYCQASVRVEHYAILQD